MTRLFSLLVSILLLPAPLAAEISEVTDSAGYTAALVAPLDSNVPILEKEIQTSNAVAGLTKLLALVTLCEAMDAGIIARETVMQVSEKAASVGGPTAFLEPGEQLTADELMRAAVMISAGDAIYTLAENAFGSEQVFLGNISVTTERLGIEKTLTDALGTGCAFSCYELMQLGRAAAVSPTFREFSGCYIANLVHDDGRTTELVNANRMIRFYAGCFGLMTGSSREDGYCGVFVATRNDMSYLVVIIGAPSSETRFSAATALFDYVFANYKLQQLSTAYEPIVAAQEVRNGDLDTVDLVPHETVVLLLQKNEGELTRTLELPETLAAPLAADTAVGRVLYTYADGTPVREIALYPAADVLSNGLVDILRRIARAYVVDIG